MAKWHHMTSMISIYTVSGIYDWKHQAIAWISTDLLSIMPSKTHFNEYWFDHQNFPLKKLHWKMLFAKWLKMFLPRFQLNMDIGWIAFIFYQP